MEPQNTNRLLTTKIVGSYLRHNIVGATQLPDLIISVHRALTDVGRPNPPEVSLTSAVSVRQSVRHDYVVCLDCGYRGKTLRRHISTQHGFSGDEYLRRWGLKTDHPLTAPAYSEHRSALAKQLGLGRKPNPEAASEPTTAEAAAAKADGEVEVSPKPRRTSR
jgi:MucR family transcriptional regulator, transcriptional regulator of exopolysaccharide biosynthesis